MKRMNMECMAISVLALAACLSLADIAPAKAYEGPQERALDKSLQDYASQGYNRDTTSQLNNPAPSMPQSRTASAATQLDEPSSAVQPIQHEPSTEGPQQQILDQSIMNYRIQQDSANGAPLRDVQ